MARKHRLRAVRNLLAAALLLTLLWYVKGCPLPTQEMEFHRYERQNLIDASTIVFTCESEGERAIPGRDPTMLVGVSEKTVQTCSQTHRFNIWPKNQEGATLVVLPSDPALAEQARLTIEMTHYTNDGEVTVCTLQGEKEGAVFLFRLAEDQVPGRPLALMTLFHTTDLPPYTLEFFSGDGVLLESTANHR